MLAPRSYLFTAQSTESRYERPNRGRGMPAAAKHNNMSAASATPTPITSTNTSPKPSTPSSPLVIPSRGHHDNTHESHRTQVRKERQQHGRRHRTDHKQGSISPSVAALLAITQIPVQRGGTARIRPGQRLTVDAIMQHAGVSEKEYSMSLGRSPLDLLLIPLDELEDEFAGSETGRESLMSARTVSSESMPSLDDESISEASLSLHSIATPSPRGRRSLPSRRLLTISPPGGTSLEDHPLSSPKLDVDELDFRVFQRTPHEEDKSNIEAPAPRRKSAFKSNLTASLRALRSAAKSFSSLKAPMIAPDDFLTRSIITIDPQVPFTDERMPPRLEDTPTPALRRYLNPTTNAPIEAHVPSSLGQTMPAMKCTASIQMETYKISRTAKGTSPTVISRRTFSREDIFAEAVGPVARQREMRENCDFIRIAVMEMAMRKKGKLDEHKPGRAKWALPPRKVPTKSYEIGADGVPVRWIAQFQ